MWNERCSPYDAALMSSNRFSRAARSRHGTASPPIACNELAFSLCAVVLVATRARSACSDIAASVAIYVAAHVLAATTAAIVRAFSLAAHVLASTAIVSAFSLATLVLADAAAGVVFAFALTATHILTVAAAGVVIAFALTATHVLAIAAAGIVIAFPSSEHANVLADVAVLAVAAASVVAFALTPAHVLGVAAAISAVGVIVIALQAVDQIGQLLTVNTLLRPLRDLLPFALIDSFIDLIAAGIHTASQAAALTNVLSAALTNVFPRDIRFADAPLVADVARGCLIAGAAPLPDVFTTGGLIASCWLIHLSPSAGLIGLIRLIHLSATRFDSTIQSAAALASLSVYTGLICLRQSRKRQTDCQSEHNKSAVSMGAHSQAPLGSFNAAANTSVLLLPSRWVTFIGMFLWRIIFPSPGRTFPLTAFRGSLLPVSRCFERPLQSLLRFRF